MPAAAEGLCYGRFEPGLADGWEKSVDSTISVLGAIPQRIISSPASRCTLPAGYMADKLGLARPEEDLRLQELDFGAWEGRLWRDIPREESDHWAQSYLHIAPPGGETMLMMRSRVISWLNEVCYRCFSGVNDVLVLTHSGVIKIIVADCLGMPLRNAFRLNVSFSALTMLRFSGFKSELIAFNIGSGSIPTLISATAGDAEKHGR